LRIVAYLVLGDPPARLQVVELGELLLEGGVPAACCTHAWLSRVNCSAVTPGFDQE
jgi:hypothetical protein